MRYSLRDIPRSNYSILAYFCRWAFYIHHPRGLVWSSGVRIQCNLREAGVNWQMEPGAERKTRTPRHTQRWKATILLSDHLQSITVKKWREYLKLSNKARTILLSVTGQSLKFETASSLSFARKLVGKNAKQMSVRAWLWAWHVSVE